ncbi:MAG: outer membrane protein assembly factor BamA [Paludibacteraceae bacterium]|nr:outer membrane protein assembly factor BamA [Paludibacteraceae bacterium]
MYNKIVVTLFLFFSVFLSKLSSKEKLNLDYFATPKVYEIADIKVTGATNYENSIIIGFSELSVGQKITIPGDDITNVIKRFWKQGLFSDVKVKADSISGSKIWLELVLQQRPKISEIRYEGAKKSEIEDLELSVGLSKGNQITPNLINQAKTIISVYYAEKGFLNTEINITEIPDLSQVNSVIVQIDIQKNNKIKVHKIYIEGNQHLSARKINRSMKKTNESGNILNIFSAKKFVKNLYEADKVAVVDKYNEVGYRDAYIESDTVKKYNDKKVDVYLKIVEGKKYFFRDIKWVGNTIYSSELLNQMLRIKRGDVYNAKLLNDRLMMDEDAVSNLYQDNGYLFFNVDPVEVSIDGDSIDYEMRIYEGKQAVINKIGIEGNTKLYEHVVRRELRTKPGQLYNKSDIIRTIRELAQMNQFDPEKIVPDIQPDPENGTVDITYKLETKSSDQVELSAGYGYTGLTGSLGLTFKNFAIENIFKPKTYKIVPQGEGQTFSLKGSTNGRYYTSLSASFVDPWFGKKRPNSFSVSVYHSRMSGVSDRYSDAYGSSYNPYSTSLYDNSGLYSNIFDIDPDQYLRTTGVSIGFGKRLQWPDDYFVLNADLTFQNYSLKNWSYFIMSDGSSNNLNLGLTIGRNSIDNPIYTRKGSSFSLTAQFTPPYSLFSDKDYSQITDDAERYQWLEFHKWKFKSRVYTPLSSNQKLVLMTRAEYGFLGYYNKYRKSPFETFLVGGDGMSGYSTLATDIVGLRGYSSGSLTPYAYSYDELGTERKSQNGYVYSRLTMELHYPVILEGSTTIYVLGFVEAGNCWSNFSEFNPFNLKRSAGVGVRLFLSMFGMMGVDWGYGFDWVTGENKTTGRTLSGSQFAFMIGQEF